MLHVSPGQTQPVFPSDCIFFCFLSHVKTYVDVYILPMLHFPGRRYRLAAARKTEQENGYGSQNHPPFWGFLLALVAMEKVVGLFEPFTWYGSLQLLEMELRLYPWASLSYSLHKRATVGGTLQSLLGWDSTCDLCYCYSRYTSLPKMKFWCNKPGKIKPYHLKLLCIY